MTTATHTAEEIDWLTEHSGDLSDLCNNLQLDVCSELTLLGMTVESDYDDFSWSRWFYFETEDELKRFFSMVNSLVTDWWGWDGDEASILIPRTDLYAVYKRLRTVREESLAIEAGR